MWHLKVWWIMLTPVAINLILRKSKHASGRLVVIYVVLFIKKFLDFGVCSIYRRFVGYFFDSEPVCRFWALSFHRILRKSHIVWSAQTTIFDSIQDKIWYFELILDTSCLIYHEFPINETYVSVWVCVRKSLKVW